MISISTGLNLFEKQPPIPDPEVVSFFLDDECILFSRRQQRLFHLNATAALVWYYLEEGRDVDSIVRLFAENFRIGQVAAQKDLQALLESWQANGLLGHDNQLKPVESQACVEAIQECNYALAQSWAPGDFTIHYQLLDTCFRLRLSSGMMTERILPLFRQLEVASNKVPDMTLDVIRQGSDFVLLRDGAVVDYCIDASGIAPMLHANLLMLAYDAAECLAAFHAGAVVRQDGCILMPAVSGSGKSTLTAALLQAGLGYCSDDVVLLDRDKLQVRPVPISLGIKKGSWPVLRSRFPQIDRLTTHLRGDGQQVRYLPPPATSLAYCQDNCPATTVPVSHIVFPRYAPDATGGLQALRPGEALCRMAEAGYDTNTCLTRETVGKLLNWLRTIPCFTLEYDSLDQAVARIRSLPR